jgi:ATP-dependent DNA helicase RecQ
MDEMATTKFESALAYALNAMGRKDLKLKDEQERAVRYLYDGEDVFLWLPMGFGKSLCYNCLPFLFDYRLGRTRAPASRSTVLVVSPLVSLMTDQVSSLRERRVSAAILSSHEICDKSFVATDKALQTQGMFSLLFASPEAVIGATKWHEKLLNLPLTERIVAVTVDEVHCVSKWYVSV